MVTFDFHVLSPPPLSESAVGYVTGINNEHR